MKIRNVALQAKVNSSRHNGANTALKDVLPSDFHRGVFVQCAPSWKKAVKR